MKRNVCDQHLAQSDLQKKSKNSHEVHLFSSPDTASGEGNRSVEVLINYHPINMQELFKKHIYKMDVQFTPETISEKLYRSALIEFNNKNYPSVIFAYDNQFTMYTAKELKGKSGTVAVFDKKLNKTVDLLIVTSVTCVIDMGQVKKYLTNGSSDIVPQEGIKALKIVLATQRHGLMHRYCNGLGILQYGPFSLPPFINIEKLKKCFIDGWKPYISEYDASLKLKTRLPNLMMGNISNNIELKMNLEMMQEFGIHVENQLACVSARILEEPTLAYAQNRESKPTMGSWKVLPLAQSAVLDNWAILNLDTNTDLKLLKSFELSFTSIAQELNFVISQPKQIYLWPIEKEMSVKEIKKTVFNALSICKSKNIHLVVVIFPNEYPKSYVIIKQVAELELGILTQCIRSTTLKIVFNRTTIRNILLKINSKLGGINHKLAVSKSISIMKEAIIMGGYLNQSPLNTQNTVEAAVAATHDLDGNRYNMQWRVQMKHETCIVDLEDMVHQQLIKFVASTGVLPTKMIFYRDGLCFRNQSNVTKEVDSIRRACMRVDAGYRPPLTYIMLQKKNTLRISPKDSGDGDGSVTMSRQLLPSGTVLDSHAVGSLGPPHFYLYSRPGLKTSLKPIKYEIFWNDNNFSEGQLEKITYDLCFMNKGDALSTAFPVPAQFARLAANRARIYRSHEGLRADGGSLDCKDVQAMNNFTMMGKPSMFFI